MNKVLLLIFIFLFYSYPILLLSNTNTDYSPRITLMLRTKAEQNLSHQNLLFYVRNARFAVRGNINEMVSYKAEIDWQDEDEIDMLDAVIDFKPIENFTISLGQQKQPFSYEYQKNPFEFDFANRNFINKRMSTGLRDIGILASYKYDLLIPTHIYLGVFNGNGINALEKDHSKMVSGRIDWFMFDGYRFSISGVKGRMLNDKVEMINLSTEYNTKHWHFDTEFGQKKLLDLNLVYYGFYTVLAYHTYYENKYFNKITYAIRWEMYNRDPDEGKESPRRLSAGITFNLPSTNYPSTIRIDYEKYLYRNQTPSDEDKLTLEFAIRVK